MEKMNEGLFPKTFSEALQVQKSLRRKIVLRDDFDKVELIAGADVGYLQGTDRAFAAMVVFSYPEMRVLEESHISLRVSFPYIPGLLSFREGPALVEVFRRLEKIPDVIVFDGQGIAHPRRMGIATHMGILLDKPTIGCAKSVLVGKYKEPPDVVGAYTFLQDGEDILGVALRTKRGVKPVFISPGYRITWKRSLEIILLTLGTYRIPQVTRKAHLLVERIKKDEESIQT